MLDWMVSQVRYEEMQREAVEFRRVRQLLQNERPTQRSIGSVVAAIGRKLIVRQSSPKRNAHVTSKTRMRSRKI